MADVSFNEEPQYASTAYAPARQALDLVTLVQKWGLAKDAKGASWVLLVVAVLAAVAALGVFLFAARAKPLAAPPLIPSASGQLVPRTP